MQFFSLADKIASHIKSEAHRLYIVDCAKTVFSLPPAQELAKCNRCHRTRYHFQHISGQFEDMQFGYIPLLSVSWVERSETQPTND